MARKRITGKEFAFRAFQTFAAFFFGVFFLFSFFNILVAKLNEEEAQKMPGLGKVLIMAIFLQIIAIVLLISLKREKDAKRAEEQAYNESVIALARHEFENVDIDIDETSLITLLEPQRVNIQTLQKKYDKPKFGVTLPGPLIVITLVIVAIQEWQKNRIKEKLDTAKNAFYNDYRRRIAEPLLNTCFPGYKYYPAQGITKEELVKLNVFHTISLSKVMSEDYVEGTYKNIHYHQSDLIAKDVKSKSTTTFFNGRVGIYDYRKSGFTGELIITSKKYVTYINNGGLNKIEMESMEFNRTFNVYADTPHTAYFILTPHFMEHIMDLNAYGDLYIRIVEDKICILRNHVTGMFEPDLTKPLDIKLEIGRSYFELKEIERFIDVLNIEGTPEEPKYKGDYNKSTYDYESSSGSLAESTTKVTDEPKTTSTSKFKLKKD